MSYQVLARKWRPKNFQQLMGQEHVVTVLVNALTQQRLHHAYLFTGTRGVGKTTIARIFAKSLNCEQGITAKPCGECGTCLDIDQGRFIDLLEIDAASKTKVDDTREILDNVQYAPTRGRFKVYLIDEVHMLSRHSFNALLKTLEEPPEHVKFILATTDPQKLPVTVLSRCLQFHLKALTVTQIETKLVEILSSEQVTHDAGSLTLLAKAARGSMRDSLSLTDQAIAQGEGAITLSNVQQMLGSIDQGWLYKIVIALLKQDGKTLIELSKSIASYAPSYSQLFAELIQLFHQIALLQIIDQHFDLPKEHADLLKKFSQAMSAEDIQLYYQICLNGRKDLPYAFDEQAAFDMTLLRLLAFKPMKANDVIKEALLPEIIVPPIDFTEEELVLTTVEKVEPQVLTATNEIPSEIVEIPAEIAEIPITEPTAQVTLEQQPEAFESPNQQLAAEMQHIEQQAQQLIDDEPKPSMVQSFIEPVTLDVPAVTANELPISAVLSGRNMLRSRKKQLEGGTKKSKDALSRQTLDATNQQPISTVDANKHTASEVIDKSINLDTAPTDEYQAEKIDPATIKHANQVDKWAHMIDSMGLNGRIRQLAIHATISESSTDDHLALRLDQINKHLNTETAQQQIQQFISDYLNKPVLVTIELVETTVSDPFKIQSDINDKRYDYAKELLQQDDIVLALQHSCQATLDEQSISAR